VARAGSPPGQDEATYAMGAVARLTGLSEHVLRAWERRYGAVEPQRTAGGSRRYRESHVRRLRLLRDAVEAGHPISELAALPDAELERRVEAARPPPPDPMGEIVAAVEGLDAAELDRLLAMHFAALGPRVFAREIALPMLHEIGRRWERGELSVAAEHLASAVARSTLGAALKHSAVAARGAPLVFATPAGERHELGTLVAALTAASAGARVVYLGADLPAEELHRAAETLGARAVALGIVTLDGGAEAEFVSGLRRRLPAEVEIWVGGPGGARQREAPGVVPIPDLDALERRVRDLSP